MRACDVCADAYCDYYSDTKTNDVIGADRDCVDAPPTTSTTPAHVQYRELKGTELDQYPPEDEEEDEEQGEEVNEEEVKNEEVKTNGETS